MQHRVSFSKRLALFLSWLPFLTQAQADTLTVGQPAPPFQLKTQDGNSFNLASRKDQGWTVLYFYPKAGTPGCTTQACAFRDGIQAIRNRNAEVYGISTDEIQALSNFRNKHHLTFTLLSDPDASVTSAYGVKMPVLTMAKRRTFIIDPSLTIRRIDEDVDPALDAQRVSESLTRLQSEQGG